MAIRELEAAVTRSDGIPVVDLVGDIDANAEALGVRPRRVADVLS